MSEIEDKDDIQSEYDEVIEGQETEVEEEEEEVEEEQEQESEEKEEREQEAPQVDKALINKVRRENFRYLNKIQELQNQLALEREEAAQLRYLNDVSTQTALNHYEIAAKERLDRARDMKEAALESGDNKALIEADIALGKAVNEYETLRREKATQEFHVENEMAAAQARMQAQQANPYQQYPARPTLTEENFNVAEQWVNENDWFNTRSSNYDYERHMLANQLLDNLDAYCYQNGLANKIGSPEYFEALNQQLGQYSQAKGAQMSKPSQQQASRQQAPRGVVAPARGRSMTGGSGSGVRGKEQPLSSAERSMIQRLGVTEKDYRLHKARAVKTDYMADQKAQWKERHGN
jgi:hypothetical protein